MQQYSFDGVLLDTRNFALLNAGATVSLKTDGRLLHRVTYTAADGAGGDGNSLHFREGGVVVDAPSPGAVRGAVASDSGGSVGDGSHGAGDSAVVDSSDAGERDTESSVTDTQTSSDVRQRDTAKDTPPVFVSDPSVVFSASATRFSVVRQNDGQEEVLYGLWNFGDGAYTQGTVVEHMYLHPGAYIIVFQGLGEDGSEGFALQKEIRVLFPQVSIERVDDAFVRLHNRHPFVLDVSGWRIESQGTVFDFPMHSLVPRQNSIVVPFAVDAGQDVFFVTAGGGQFNGTYVSPVVNAAEEGAVEQEVDAAAVSALERSVPVEQHDPVQEGVVDERDRVSVVGYTTASVEGVVTDQDAGRADRSVRMIVVWVVLLIGIMVVALVPFILTRREKARRFDHS